MVVSSDDINTRSFPFTNRTGYQSGNQVSLDYTVGRVGGDMMDVHPTPLVSWMKDGVPFRTTPTNTPVGNGLLTTSLSFSFLAADAGVYQCVFTDTGRSEVLVSSPIRLDTGEYSHIHTCTISVH